MVIVVPAFAEREQREEPVVLAGVGRFVADCAEEVRERIDGEGVMPEQDRAKDKSPQKEREAADQVERDAQHGGRNEVKFIEPAQLWEFREVYDVIRARVVVTIGNDPTDVRPEKAEERGRVEILFLVGKTMMVAMMRRPPEDAFLRGRHGHKGDHELKYAACLVGAMRKIAVITGGHPKHAAEDERDASDQVGPLERDEKDAKGQQMHQRERR